MLLQGTAGTARPLSSGVRFRVKGGHVADTLENRVKTEIDDLVRIGAEIVAFAGSAGSGLKQDWVIKASSWAVSYTHLTLPTILLV